MDKEDSIRLIQLYGSFKMLWDSKDPDHLNKSKREDSWRKISKKMKLPIPELKKKLDSLTEELAEKIIQAANELREDKAMIQRSTQHVALRATACLQRQGGHFEQFL
ncbi:unnamed protein product [Parnassius mnemosyne]|uniref:MADF domain-containing protein n=1 Tax=Parnassius mnemosyne TaxID=213953 RepID=A0AAV1LDT4_9NEOP